MRDAVLDAVLGGQAPTRWSWPPRSPTSGRRRAATAKLARGGALTLELEPTEDILAEVGVARAGEVSPASRCSSGSRPRPARSTGRREKLRRKGADLLVANDVAEAGSGFGTDTNRVVILAADGSRDDLPLLTKREVADRLLDRVAAALDARDARAHTGADQHGDPMSAQSDSVRRLSVVDIARLYADGTRIATHHRLRLPDRRARRRGGHPADPRRRLARAR